MFGSKRWYLFKLMGNKVYMTPMFLIIMAIFAFSGVSTAEQLQVGVLWIPVLFVSLLLHELGHALMSKKLGFGNSEIVFWGLGGVAINRSGRRRSPRDQILISLAGPAVSFALALVSAGALWGLSGGLAPVNYLGQFLNLMFTANLFWAVFNMLPIYPMDGGQAMRAGFRAAFKRDARANRTTGIVSIATIVLAVVGSMALFARPDIFLVLLGAYFGYINYQLIKGQRTGWGA